MEAATSETIYTSQLPANILMLIFSAKVDDLLYLFNINAGQYLVAFLFYLQTSHTGTFSAKVDDVLYLTTMY